MDQSVRRIEKPSLRRRFCLRGHDTHVHGRTNGGCYVCHLARCRARYAAKTLEHRRRTPEHNRRSNLWRLYRITPEYFEKLAANQSHCCAICGRKAQLVVDHDHTSGAIRGLLCHACNLGLGKFGDSVPSLLKAAQYLAATA